MSGLQLDQDLEFSRRSWAVQRAARILGLMLILAAAAGLFGRGPLARDTAVNEGLVVRYERQAHALSPAMMEVDVPPGKNGADQEFRLWIDRAYLDAAQLLRIVPSPVETEVSEHRVEYVLRRSAGEPVRLTLEFEMREINLVDARLGIVDGPAVEFRQIILP